MKLGKFRIEILEGDAEGVTFSGSYECRRTVLLHVGNRSISKRALQLGGILALCQILDGLLTWLGVSVYGVKLEGNAFIRMLIEAYGAAPALLVAKLFAVSLVVFLTWYAHGRRWFRPMIVLLSVIYVMFAIWPWTYIMSNHYFNIHNSHPTETVGRP